MSLLSPSSEHLLRTVAAALPGGSVNVFDRAFRYLFVAGDGLEGAALSPDRLLGRTLADVFGAEAALVEPFYARAFAGERVSFDLPVFGRIYALTAAPFLAAIDAIIVLAQDVTVTRGERQRHDTAEATSRAVNQERDVFLATMLHELRQPLAPLRFGVELLQRLPDVPPPLRTVAAMDRQIQQLERLVVDLTDLVAGRTKGLAVRLEHVDLVQLLRDVLHDAETLMQSKQHALDAQLPSSPIHVQGDGGRLRQVFSNLLLNAAKYTDPGGQISVTATCEGGHVAVSVRDTGRGIDPATLPRIFDLFVQEDSTGPGLGIGLHLVLEVVERHGGHIHAHSEGRGRGSEFVVRLPIHEDG